MATATESVAERRDREYYERSLHHGAERFVSRWTDGMGSEERSKFHVDLVLLIQAVHRDAMRETHALLKNALAVMPPSPIIIRKD